MAIESLFGGDAMFRRTRRRFDPRGATCQSLRCIWPGVKVARPAPHTFGAGIVVQACLHIANALYLVSFLARDMLWLRILTCGGLVMGVIFFACQPIPLYGCIVWHVVFLIINTVQIRRLILERRAFMLTKEQERVGEATFRDLSREEVLTLLTRAMCENPKRLRDIHHSSHQPLTKEECVLRDIAFSRLSRTELLNLLTRRMWNSITRLNPARWRRYGRTRRATPPDDSAADVA
jgi:hypothetical protein